VIRVLVVDDSLIVRMVTRAVLARISDIAVVGEAGDAYEARERIVELDLDVITLDIEMPRMDGLTFLRLLMQHHPKPVVVISSLTSAGSAKAIEALHCGAVEVLGKPGPGFSNQEYALRLVAAIRGATRARLVRHATPPPSPLGSQIIAPVGTVLAIGASTGGPEAVRILLAGLPAGGPAAVIVQHMPAGFTHGFAARLDLGTSYRVTEACGGEELRPGHAFVAPGGHHLEVVRAGDRLLLHLSAAPAEHFQRPAVDVTFRSLAAACGPEAIGVLLTGMGEDGAVGLLAMRRAGAHTIAQDEASSAVFGMPRAAMEIAAAVEVLPLLVMAPAIVARCSVIGAKRG